MKNIKTTTKIEKALLTLLQTNDINQITTKQIAQTADINRVTIYRHYNDKWDILEKIEQNFLHKLDIPHVHMIANIQLTNQTQETEPKLRVLIDFLEVFQENFPILKVLMEPNANLGFANKLMNYLINLEAKSHPYMHLSISKSEQELLSYYSISALIGIIQYWIKNPRYSAKEMAHFFFKMRFGAIKELKI
ncbi:TetR/AcrR family transcriptional regulator [Lactobacillus crispatus]|uniref:TetR/AcrR family transcriptional regulator n=1 Tax=Lactobacillus crispatus TaxID=47770 RepID=UPI0018AA39CA|nr:TetR/AcrR family transcriptional regulator [Lactobacillus crispatus]